jgi:hypothetical protein
MELALPRYWEVFRSLPEMQGLWSPAQLMLI